MLNYRINRLILSVWIACSITSSKCFLEFCLHRGNAGHNEAYYFV